LKAGILEWENPRVTEILDEIKKCEKDLHHFESEVKTIKTKCDEKEE